jgi:hypothetical protein
MDAIPFSSRYTFHRKAFQIGRAMRQSRTHLLLADFLQKVYLYSFFESSSVRLCQIVPRPIARKKEIQQSGNKVVEKRFHALPFVNASKSNHIEG